MAKPFAISFPRFSTRSLTQFLTCALTGLDWTNHRKIQWKIRQFSCLVLLFFSRISRRQIVRDYKWYASLTIHKRMLFKEYFLVGNAVFVDKRLHRAFSLRGCPRLAIIFFRFCHLWKIKKCAVLTPRSKLAFVHTCFSAAICCDVSIVVNSRPT